MTDQKRHFRWLSFLVALTLFIGLAHAVPIVPVAGITLAHFTSTKKSMDKEYTIEEIEKKETPPEDGRVPHVPFGFQNQKWLQFKSRIQPGDKIYDFSSSAESWQNLAGRAGYILVREGKVIDTLVTIMN